MSYRVSVKPGHPTGVRRRSHQVFTSTPLEVESVTEEMLQDEWLHVVPVDPPSLTPEERAEKEAAERAAKEASEREDEESETGNGGDDETPTSRRGRRR